MREPWQCNHPDESVTLKRRVVGPQQVMFGHQCKTCGRLVGMWVKKERIPKPDALPAWDFEIQERWQDSEREYAIEYRKQNVNKVGVVAFAKPADDSGLKELFNGSYKAYLASPQWMNKRVKILDRASGMCEGCAERQATQVHHLTYDRVGKEMLFDLVALCESCHKSIHGIA